MIASVILSAAMMGGLDQAPASEWATVKRIQLDVAPIELEVPNPKATIGGSSKSFEYGKEHQSPLRGEVVDGQLHIGHGTEHESTEDRELPE